MGDPLFALVFIFWFILGIIANKKNWNNKENKLIDRGWYFSKEWDKANTKQAQQKFFQRHSYSLNGWTLSVVTSALFAIIMTIITSIVLELINYRAT